MEVLTRIKCSKCPGVLQLERGETETIAIDVSVCSECRGTGYQEKWLHINMLPLGGNPYVPAQNVNYRGAKP